MQPQEQTAEGLVSSLGGDGVRVGAALRRHMLAEPLKTGMPAADYTFKTINLLGTRSLKGGQVVSTVL